MLLVAVGALAFGISAVIRGGGSDASGPFDPEGKAGSDGLDTFEARFSPDGEHVVARVLDAVLQSRLAEAQEGRLRLFTDADMEVAGFAWMPGSESVLVAHQKEDRVVGLAEVGLDGTVLREVPLVERFWVRGGMAVRGDGSAAILSVQPAVSGARPTDFVEVDLGTGAVRRLTDTPVESEGDPVLLDEHRLVFGGGQLTTDFGGPNGYVAVLNLENGRVQRLTPDDHVVSGLTVSPDGRRIVYEAFVGRERRTGGLFAMPVGGGDPTPIVRDGVRWPWFHPNGDALVVTRVGGPGDPGGLQLIELDGTGRFG